jgi:hypothetical protein
MTKKADFNAEEWSKVVEGPLFAGLRVVAAERGGTIRESIALGKAYAEARQRAGESELLDELVAQAPTLDRNRVQAGGDIAATADAGLREAAAILTEKATPEEIESYRSFTLTVAEAVANAHKEGGFLGVGGKPVSASEQEALDAVAAILQPSGGGADPA